MRAVALHPDVLLVSSALLRAKCVIVRGADGGGVEGETFVIDSPLLPEELEALPTVISQATFPAASGLLATHGDWDHVLGRLAFPELALGCAEGTVRRMRASPGEAQRELRAFDEELGIDRALPLGLGDVQALAVPGRCELGSQELELHLADGHTADGMAIHIPWAGVLVAGDYLSSAEIPQLDAGNRVEQYLATLERLGALLGGVEHVIPGHGAPLEAGAALSVCEQDISYLRELVSRGAAAELPEGRRGRLQRAAHERNVAALASPPGS